MSAPSADVAHTPMPQTHPTASGTGLTPVPVALLLPPPARNDDTTTTPGGMPDWCGITARDIARLIATYSEPDDIVLNLDAHPTINGAAAHLHRHPVTPLTDRDPHRVPCKGVAPEAMPRHDAGLLVVSLPCAGIKGLDVHDLARAVRTWRPALRPGGYLLVALRAPTPELGATSPRATVIAAARAAGLIYHQHILAVLAPLPEVEPRAMPDTAASTTPALRDGRHAPAFHDVLVFATTAGGTDA
ncbi:MAG TPA: hypothetical protein VES42_22750 [Pilimelia sp.]|nr:hypothetical protein [Pilimelia sp.]